MEATVVIVDEEFGAFEVCLACAKQAGFTEQEVVHLLSEYPCEWCKED